MWYFQKYFNALKNMFLLLKTMLHIIHGSSKNVKIYEGMANMGKRERNGIRVVTKEA